MNRYFHTIKSILNVVVFKPHFLSDGDFHTIKSILNITFMIFMSVAGLFPYY